MVCAMRGEPVKFIGVSPIARSNDVPLSTCCEPLRPCASARQPPAANTAPPAARPFTNVRRDTNKFPLHSVDAHLQVRCHATEEGSDSEWNGNRVPGCLGAWVPEVRC